MLSPPVSKVSLTARMVREYVPSVPTPTCEAVREHGPSRSRIRKGPPAGIGPTAAEYDVVGGTIWVETRHPTA